MPLDLNCPKCDHLFPVSEVQHPVGVQCPACDVDLTVEFRKVATPVPGQSPHELLVALGEPAGDPPPLPTEGKKLRPDDEDEEAKRTGGGMGIVVAAALTALAASLGGLGALGYVLFTNLDTSDATAGTTRRSGTPGGGPKGPNITRPTPNPRPTPGGPVVIPRPGENPFVPPKPKGTKFDLRPVVGPPPPISPPPLPSDTSNIKLPGRVEKVAVGGGGRYILMHIREKGVLGLFDVTTARFHTVPSDTGDVKLAAGRTKAVAFSEANGRKVYTVYNLPTLDKAYEYVPKDPATGKDDHFFGAVAVAMGSKTDGPLLAVMFGGDVLLYEIGPDRLDLVEAASNRKPADTGVRGNHLRALPDGTAYVAYDESFRNSGGVQVLTVANRDWKVTSLNHTPFPGPDGHFYGNGIVVDKNGRDQRVSGGGAGAGSGTWFVPAVSGGNQFLKVVPVEVTANTRPVKTLTVTVHAGRNGQIPVAGTQAYTNLPEFENMADVFGNGVNVPLEEHFFLIPEAKLLVILSGKRTELVLRKVGK